MSSINEQFKGVFLRRTITHFSTKLLVVVIVIYAIFQINFQIFHLRFSDYSLDRRTNAEPCQKEIRGEVPVETGGKGIRITNVTMATVACGNLELVKTMLKSLVLFSGGTQLHMILFTDDGSKPALEKSVLELQVNSSQLGLHFTYDVKLVWFPDDGKTNWKTMHLNCTNQRLFFPSLLKDVDALIYLDTDMVVTGSILPVWEEFSKMDRIQVAAATQNAEFLHNISMYNPGKGHPYIGPQGMNAGMMLMNLTRMRTAQIEDLSVAAYRKYADRISFADQDILNIVFGDHPYYMRSLSCIYNLYWIHCPFYETKKGKPMCMAVDDTEEPLCKCQDVDTKGVYIVHGNYGYFRGPRNSSMFPSIYNIFKEYKLGDSWKPLVEKMASEYRGVQKKCYMTDAQLVQNAKHYFENQRVIKP